MKRVKSLRNEKMQPGQVIPKADMSRNALFHRGIEALRSCWFTLLDKHSKFAIFPLVLAVILLFCGGSAQINRLHTDAGRYQCYALAFWLGSRGLHLLPASQCALYGLPAGNVAPFHILPLEYPPLTLTIFSLALASPLQDYQICFAILMAITVALIYWLLLCYGPRGSAIACAFYLVIGAWATAEVRFDLVPAGLTLLCLILAERRRWTLAYIALAVAFLLKLYPLLLLPALFLAEQIDAGRLYYPDSSFSYRAWPDIIGQTLRGVRQWRWKNMLLFLGLILVVSALFALLNFQGAILNQLSYFTNRPIQVESTGSLPLWLATLFGHPVETVYTFGSVNMVGDLDNLVAFAFDILFVLGYVLTILWQWRGKLDVVQAFILLLLVFVVTSKVFSPQYLIWLIPLLAYNGAFSRLWLLLWGSLCLITTLVYPYLYALPKAIEQVPTIPGFIEGVTVRDALFVLITLAFLFNWWDLNRRKTFAAEIRKEA
jgi:hypothetical protein